MGVGWGGCWVEAVEDRLELLVLGGRSDPFLCACIQGAEST